MTTEMFKICRFRTLNNSCTNGKSFVFLLCISWWLTIASESMAVDTDFYIVAHADDWQLFMGDKAWADVHAGHKVIFVQLGAASNASWPNWEEGNQLSIESLAGADASEVHAACLWQMINSHPICKRSYNNTAAYYLRLPVAHYQTRHGFEVSKFQTLEQTHLGVNILESLGENATRYESFSDLVSTLASIVGIELDASDTTRLTINAQDPDTELNVNDHIDHLTAGCAAFIIARKASARLRLYLDYNSQSWPDNLDAQSVEVKTRLFSIFDTKVGIGINPDFSAFLRRTIFREILLYGVPSGAITSESLSTSCEMH